MPFRPHEIQYEQCLWKEKHVLALYPRLQGMVIADGEWHDFPPVPTSFGRYRVYEGTYFQALFSNRSASELDEYCVLAPATIDDDAEWLLWRDDPDDVDEGYVLTSKFAVAPGPFGHHSTMLHWLERHALGLEPNKYHVQGVAYFINLNSAELTDAIERLTWLEVVMAGVNRYLQECSRSAWAGWEKASDVMLSQEDPASEEITLCRRLRANEAAKNVFQCPTNKGILIR